MLPACCEVHQTTRRTQLFMSVLQSCEMIFGEMPKPIIEDEVYNEPCFIHQCAISHRDPQAPCPKISTACNKGVLSST